MQHFNYLMTPVLYWRGDDETAKLLAGNMADSSFVYNVVSACIAEIVIVLLYFVTIVEYHSSSKCKRLLFVCVCHVRLPTSHLGCLPNQCRVVVVGRCVAGVYRHAFVKGLCSVQNAGEGCKK